MTMLIPTEKQTQLTATLDTILAKSDSLKGAALVSLDGAVYSSNLPDGITDETLVGVATAGLLGISEREALELHQGHVQQAIIQCDLGNILVTRLTNAVFVGLTTNRDLCGLPTSMAAIAADLEAVL